MSPSDQVDAAIDGLYRLDRDVFVGKRNALAQQLKDAGDGAQAKRVRACKKPSLSAWVANRLWWEHREEFDALVAATREVGDAQAAGAGPSERSQADRRRRRVHQRLMDAAQSILSEGGHATSASTLRRISTTLDAVAARDPASLEPPPGRLVDDLDPPGFDLLSALATMGSAPPSAEPSPEPSAEPSPELGPDARQVAQAQLDEARVRAVDAARLADEADRARDEAQSLRDDLAASLREAQARLESARQAVERIDRKLRNASRVADERTGAAQEAAARAKDARAAQTRAEDALAELQR